MLKAILALGAISVIVVGCFGTPVRAADLAVPRGVARAHVGPYCGPCGCLRVTYVRHRSVETTYGLSYDPRNYDQTEPHHYLGPVRSYPQYSVEGCAGPDCS